jgi:hypothetical protein
VHARAAGGTSVQIGRLEEVLLPVAFGTTSWRWSRPRFREQGVERIIADANILSDGACRFGWMPRFNQFRSTSRFRSGHLVGLHG